MADVLIAKGELESAVSLLRGAAAALAPTGYSWGPLAWMLLAQALGQLGGRRPEDRGQAGISTWAQVVLFARSLRIARAVDAVGARR